MERYFFGIFGILSRMNHFLYFLYRFPICFTHLIQRIFLIYSVPDQSGIQKSDSFVSALFQALLNTLFNDRFTPGSIPSFSPSSFAANRISSSQSLNSIYSAFPASSYFHFLTLSLICSGSLPFDSFPLTYSGNSFNSLLIFPACPFAFSRITLCPFSLMTFPLFLSYSIQS